MSRYREASDVKWDDTASRWDWDKMGNPVVVLCVGIRLSALPLHSAMRAHTGPFPSKANRYEKSGCARREDSFFQLHSHTGDQLIELV